MPKKAVTKKKVARKKKVTSKRARRELQPVDDSVATAETLNAYTIYFRDGKKMTVGGSDTSASVESGGVLVIRNGDKVRYIFAADQWASVNREPVRQKSKKK